MRGPQQVLSIDPGETNGWSLWLLPPFAPMRRLDYGSVRVGVRGLIDFLTRNLVRMDPDVILLERYEPRSGPEDLALDAAHAEGALLAVTAALGRPEPVMRRASEKRGLPDADLRAAGFWIENSDPKVEWHDARDVNDSQIHALGWAADNGHQPTMRMLWPPT